jgi:hypothetical protein
MTEKENFLKVIRGETPEWVPRFTMSPEPYATKPQAAMPVTPGFLNARRTKEGGFDIFGVEYIATTEMSGAALPKPNQFILGDITRWRDVIKAPDISAIDWEAMARDDFKKSGRDPEDIAVILHIHVGYFQHLMNFMGFTEGLCAMAEEPEEVYALLDYLSDFYLDVAKKAIYHYKPDVFDITDDTAAAQNPFISLDMFRRLIKPFHAKMAQAALDNGLPIMMHNCGHCEAFIEDWLDYGVSSWNPAQVMNDLVGIKKKYGNKLVLIGCCDSSGPAGWPDAPEAIVRQAVRDVIDTFAPGGGFMFWGSAYGTEGDETLANKKRWITSEYETYRATPYK